MTPEQYQQLIELLTQTGTAAYEAARWHVIVDSIFGIFFWGTFFVLSWIGGREALRANENDIDPIPDAIIVIITGVVLMTFGAIVMVNVKNLIALDFSSLQRLMSLIPQSQ